MKKIYLTLSFFSLALTLCAQEKTSRKIAETAPQKQVIEKPITSGNQMDSGTAFVEAKKADAVNATATPYGNSAFSNLISNISLSSALNNGENAKIELKYTKTNSSNWWLTPGLTVDQKLGKNDKKANFYDFNKGISPGTTVGLNLQAMYWNPVLSKSAFDTFTNLKNQYATDNGIADPRTVTYMDMMGSGDAELQKKLKNIRLKTPIFFNFKFSFTKTKFAYATDSVSLNKIEETHLSPDLGLAIGMPIGQNNFIALSYIYSESYESADELNFSRKFGTTSNTFSQTLAFGKPTFKKDHKIISEFRQALGKDANFAIAPSIAYGLSSKKAAFTLPIYFIQGFNKESKPNGLQGGVNLGYSTATDSQWSKFKDGFGAQLILTAPFSIFGSMF